MATLSIQTINRDGLQPSFAAADVGGDDFPNTGQEFVFIKNGGGGAMNVTLVTTQTVDGQAVADRVVNIPAGEDRLIGGFPFTAYNDDAQSGGSVNLTYDIVTSVTIAIIRHVLESFA